MTRTQVLGRVFAIWAVGLAGCATYRAKPLAGKPDLAATLSLPAGRFSVPVSVPDRIDPSQPLTGKKCIR